MLLERGVGSNMQSLVLTVIIVVVAVVIVVVLMVVELCGGSQLHPLSEDLFLPRVLNPYHHWRRLKRAP